MALPVTIPNEFANATASIPLSQLDTNFNTLANAVNGISDGSETLANVTATVVNATTVDTTNIEVTNIKAKDGTAAGSIADSTGVVTLASSVLTTTDINGGTIDGTAIGGASAAAGAFTTLNTSGAVVFNDAGADVDFRVEGDTNANVLFVDASADAVGIRTNSLVASDVKFEVRDGIVAITDSTGGDCRLFMGGSTSPNHSKGQIRYSNADESLEFYANSAERMRIDSSGNVIVGGTAQQGSAKLSVVRSTAGEVIRWTDLATGGAIATVENVGQNFIYNGALLFSNGATERARITDGGNLVLTQNTTKGPYISSGDSVSVASGGTVNLTAGTAGAVLVCVFEPAQTGNGGVFFGTYSTVITKIAGDGDAADSGSGIAVYKGSNSHTITFKNKYAVTRSFRFAIYSALAAI